MGQMDFITVTKEWFDKGQVVYGREIWRSPKWMQRSKDSFDKQKQELHPKVVEDYGINNEVIKNYIESKVGVY
jgi:hypothetical protein